MNFIGKRMGNAMVEGLGFGIGENHISHAKQPGRLRVAAHEAGDQIRLEPVDGPGDRPLPFQHLHQGKPVVAGSAPWNLRPDPVIDFKQPAHHVAVASNHQDLMTPVLEIPDHILPEMDMRGMVGFEEDLHDLDSGIAIRPRDATQCVRAGQIHGLSPGRAGPKYLIRMLPRISKPNLLKLALLALLLGLVLGLRFMVVPAAEAGELVVRTGYYFVGLNFLLFVYFFARLLVFTGSLRQLQSHLPGLLLCVVLTLVTHLQEPHRFKVLNDEFALLNMSMAMHHYQKAGLMGQAHRIDGEMEHTEFTAGKRSLFFQYLLSLIHGVSGYRPQNAFVLNLLVTGVFFTALCGVLGLLVRRRLLVFSGLLTAASIPLLPDIATSGGYDLLNAAMILMFILVGTAYLKSPTPGRQSAFVLTALLLAQVRYESILYLLALAVIVAFVWIRQGDLKLSWISATSPVFLFIPLMLNAHMFANDTLQDAGVRKANQAFMGMEFLWPNLKDAARFFFDPDSSILNSVPVAILGVAGLTFAVWQLTARRGAGQPGDRTVLPVLGCVIAVAALCFLIMTLNFWGVLTDPQATRFAMPVYLLGTICGFWLLDRVILGTRAPWWVLGVALALNVSTLITVEERRQAAAGQINSRYQEWVIAQAGNNSSGSRLNACDGTLGLVAWGHAALPIEVVNLLAEDMAALSEAGLYDSFIAFELLHRDATTGNLALTPTTSGLDRDRYRYEIVAEKPLPKGFVARAYRITGWIGDDKTFHPFKPSLRADPAAAQGH